MSGSERLKNRRNRHDEVGAFPLLAMLPGLTGALGGGGGNKDSSGEAVRKALAEEQARQAAAKVAADQARKKLYLGLGLGALGVAGIVTTIVLLRRK